MALVALAFAGLGVKKYIDRNKDNTSNLSRSDIVRQFAETPASQPQPQAPLASVPKSDSRDLRGPGNVPPTVLGSSINADSGGQIGTSASDQNPTPPQPKPYRNDALGFEITLPAGALINTTDTQVTAAAPGGKNIYWSITVYNRTAETINSLINELSRSPSVTSLSKTTLAGQAALKFSSPNLKGAQGFAVIANGRLYYLVGNFSDPSLLKDLKFF